MIQIAEHLFRPSEIGVVDRVERDAAGPVRRISCCGLVRPAWMGASPRERIDLLAATLLVSTDPIPLSIRPGRRLWARARRLVRELARQRAIDLARTEGVDLVAEIGAAQLALWIDRLVQRIKTGR